MKPHHVPFLSPISETEAAKNRSPSDVTDPPARSTSSSNRPRVRYPFPIYSNPPNVRLVSILSPLVHVSSFSNTHNPPLSYPSNAGPRVRPFRAKAETLPASPLVKRGAQSPSYSIPSLPRGSHLFPRYVSASSNRISVL